MKKLILSSILLGSLALSPLAHAANTDNSIVGTWKGTFNTKVDAVGKHIDCGYNVTYNISKDGSGYKVDDNGILISSNNSDCKKMSSFHYDAPATFSDGILKFIMFSSKHTHKVPVTANIADNEMSGNGTYDYHDWGSHTVHYTLKGAKS